MTKQEVIEKVKSWAEHSHEGTLRTPYKEGSKKERNYRLAWWDAMNNVLDLLDTLEEE